MQINGIPVYMNDHICIKNEMRQYRFPKSKKRRIRKKWSKREINFRPQEVHYVYKMKDRVVMSTKAIEQLINLPYKSINY